MHHPVMAKEVISSLNLKKGDMVLDATVGGGGHAEDILKRITPGGFLIGFDADPAAIKMAEEKLAPFTGSYRLIHGNFSQIDNILAKAGLKGFDAILFDLGVSSYQFDEPSRGFSIKSRGTLDMRMDPAQKISAYDIINKFREEEIARILWLYGEERFSRKIARRIAYERSAKPIETTEEFADIVRRAIGPRGPSRRRIDPATRSFQAIRIAVNDELQAAEEGLKKAVFWLKESGRLAVISFHSLEDRIAKKTFKGFADLGIVKILTKKPLIPQEAEVRDNPRSRSAKLRVCERI